MKLRSHLLALILGTLFPVLAFSAVMMILFNRQTLVATEKGLVETARALSVAIDREVNASFSVLNALAASPRLEKGDLRGFYANARSVLGIHGTWDHMILYTPDGLQVLNTARPFGERLPTPANDELVRRVARSGTPTISDLFTSDVLQQPFVLALVPVMHAGSARYVLGAAMSPTALSAVLLQERPSPESICALLDRSKVIIARTRALERFVGQRGTPDLAAKMDETTEGAFRLFTKERQPVYAAISRSSLTGWTIAMGVPVAAVDAPLRSSLWPLIGVAAACSLLGALAAAVAARRIAQPIHALASSAAALMSGHPLSLPRSPIVEVNDVARALETASQERQRVEARNAELLEANERRRHEAETLDGARGARALAEASALRFRELVQSLDAIVWEADLSDAAEGNAARNLRPFTFVSQQAEALLGFPVERWLTEPGFWVSRIHPEDREMVLSACQRGIDEARDVGLDYRMVATDGRTVWMQEMVRVIRDDAGRVHQRRGVMVDVTEHVRAEDARHATERHLAGLLSIAPDAIIAFDAEQRITRFNQGAETIFGYRTEEVLGQPLDLLLPQRFIDAHRAHIQAFSASPEGSRRMNERGVIYGRRRDGTEFPAEASIAKLVQNGEMSYSVILRDITERKRAEEATQALVQVGHDLAETLDPAAVGQRIVDSLRTLLGTQNAYLWRHEPATGTLEAIASSGGSGWFPLGFILPPGVGVTGRAVVEHRAVTTTDTLSDPAITVPPDLRTRAEHSEARAVLAIPLIVRDQVIGGLSVGDRAGRVFDAAALQLAQAFADQAGLAMHNARLYQESERRRHTAEALAEVGRLLSHTLDPDVVAQRIVDSTVGLLALHSCAVFRLDPLSGDLRLIAQQSAAGWEFSPILERGTGFAGVAVRERQTVVTADPLADPRVTYSADARARVGLSPARVLLAVPLLAKDAATGALVAADRPDRVFTDDDKRLVEAFAAQAATALENARLFQNVRQAYEELAQTQEQLLQSQKMDAVGQLAGGIAHDFNNLLAVITGRALLLLRRPGLGDQARRDAEQIKSAGHRAAELTRQLLAFSRKQVLQPKVLDLNGIVGGISAMLHRLIGEHIELVTRLDPALGRVKADPGQLEQILVNLAVNARDAIPQGGSLTIETGNLDLDASFAREHPDAPSGAHAFFRVADTGTGMTPDIRSRIFEPFFTTKGPGQGTGLGLSTVYGIVKQHEGYITVDSTPGRGTTFTVYLRRVEEPLESTMAEPAAFTARRRTGTILLVEDEEGVRDLAREMLVEASYTVLAAASGAAALEMSAQYPGPIDLLITDVVLPGMSGRELADRFRQLRPQMKVLYMSGYTDQAIGQHGVLAPGTELLEKPFTPDSLVRKLDEVLGAFAIGSPADERTGGTMMSGIVLIVDDEAEVRATLGDYLRQEGFDVLEAANGLEALLQVRRVRPRAVVLDLMMPRLGGLDTLKRIRAFDPAIGVVLVTGTEDIELHRQALALGALAVFTKPLQGPALVAALGGSSRPSAPAAPAVPAPAAAKVLVVDDEPDVLEMLEELLASMGYETRGAVDGLSGVRAALDWKPDIVLLDIEMPGLSGVSALAVIAALDPTMKVIMVSGTTNVAVSRRALAYGAFDYVTKPVDVGYLTQAIETALAMKRLESGE